MTNDMITSMTEVVMNAENDVSVARFPGVHFEQDQPLLQDQSVNAEAQN